MGATSSCPGTHRGIHGTGQCHVDQAPLPNPCSPPYSNVGVRKLLGKAQSARRIGDRQDMFHWTLANMLVTKTCEVSSCACRLRRIWLECRVRRRSIVRPGFGAAMSGCACISERCRSEGRLHGLGCARRLSWGRFCVDASFFGFVGACCFLPAPSRMLAQTGSSHVALFKVRRIYRAPPSGFPGCLRGGAPVASCRYLCWLLSPLCFGTWSCASFATRAFRLPVRQRRRVQR